MIGEIFEWILFGFFCILGVITTICESKGIFDPAAIKSTASFLWKKRYNDQAGQENKNFCPKSLRIFKLSVKIPWYLRYE